MRRTVRLGEIWLLVGMFSGQGATYTLLMAILRVLDAIGKGTQRGNCQLGQRGGGLLGRDDRSYLNRVLIPVTVYTDIKRRSFGRLPD